MIFPTKPKYSQNVIAHERESSSPPTISSEYNYQCDDEDVIEVDDSDIVGEQIIDPRYALAPAPMITQNFPIHPSEPVLNTTFLASWDGPDEEFFDNSFDNIRNSLHSLVPTPSLVPVVQAVQKGRSRLLAITAITFFALLIVVVIASAQSGRGARTAVEGSVRPSNRRPAGSIETGSATVDTAIPPVSVDTSMESETDEGARIRQRSSLLRANGERDDADVRDESNLGITAGSVLAQSVSGGAPTVPTPNRSDSDSHDTLEELTPFRRGSKRSPRPLTNEQIRSTIARYSRSIRSCHEREMRRTGMPIEGRVIVRIQVGPTGTVRSANVLSGPNVGGLKNCIEQTVRSWRFPEASGETVVESPFLLASRQ